MTFTLQFGFQAIMAVNYLYAGTGSLGIFAQATLIWPAICRSRTCGLLALGWTGN